MINKFKDKDEWFLARRGKFTSSGVYLLGVDYKGLTKGAISYIKEKAVEKTTNMWERPELEEVKSLLWGNVHELPAYDWYVSNTRNKEMLYFGTDNPIFLDYEHLIDDSGGSPDGIVINKNYKVDVGLEVKCPKNPIYHFDRLLWKDQWDLKQNYIQCYTQIQHLLMITGAYEWHFLSFDERQKNVKNKGKIIVVKPDKKFQDNLDILLKLAIKERDKLIKLHTNQL